MAKYPYVSTTTAIAKTFEQFKKSFPAVVDAGTLKKFSIAPGNESYIINILRGLGFIDDDGTKIAGATDIFFQGSEAFQKGLEEHVRSLYADLFADHGDGAWTESREVLSTWFRVADKTSALIGGRQAATFLTLASLAGYGEPVKIPAASGTKQQRASRAAQTNVRKSSREVPEVEQPQPVAAPTNASAERVGLTVRIEVNLPATGTPEVYDAIFASIRKNLIEQ